MTVKRYTSTAKLVETAAGELVLFSDHQPVHVENITLRAAVLEARGKIEGQNTTIAALEHTNRMLVSELEVLTAASGPAISERDALRHELELAQKRIEQLKIVHEEAELELKALRARA